MTPKTDSCVKERRKEREDREVNWVRAEQGKKERHAGRVEQGPISRRKVSTGCEGWEKMKRMRSWREKNDMKGR